MASHHHLCHLPPAAAAVCDCSCCYYPTYNPCHQHHHLHAPPPPPPQPYLTPHIYSDHANPPNRASCGEHYKDHRRFEDQRSSSQATVSSLLRRISTLESALRSRAAPSPRSLRDAAARTIQIHFRSFLCRRSRTLRHLRDLAAIKSTLGTLKSLVSKRAPFEYDVVYRKVVNLLLKLDSIQGEDPLIRNGKSSLTVELNKFLDLIDGSGVVKMRCRIGDLKSRVEMIDHEEEEEDEITTNFGHESANQNQGLMRRNGGGPRFKAKKNVSFMENGKVYQVLRRHHQPLLDESCDSSVDGNHLVVDDKEVEDDLCREIEDIGVSSKETNDDDEEEAQLDNVGSLQGSRSYHLHDRRRLNHDSIVDDFVFQPPLLVKMETRDDSLNKRFQTATK